jgi:hypothetical protein
LKGLEYDNKLKEQEQQAIFKKDIKKKILNDVLTDGLSLGFT